MLLGAAVYADFNFLGPMACENCKHLVQVDLMCTDISAIWGSTFSYLCEPCRYLAPAKAKTHRQRSFPLLCLASGSKNPACTSLFSPQSLLWV